MAQFRENRFALFLELLHNLNDAIPDGKPLRTFPGIASQSDSERRRSRL